MLHRRPRLPAAIIGGLALATTAAEPTAECAAGASSAAIVDKPLLLVWTRIPKTGSSSALRLLEAAMVQANFAMPGWDYEDDGQFVVEDPYHFSLSEEEQRQHVHALVRQSVLAATPRKVVYFNHRHYIDFARWSPVEVLPRIAHITILREPFAHLRSDFYWRQMTVGCTKFDLYLSEMTLCNHTLASFVAEHGPARVMQKWKTNACRFVCGENSKPADETLEACATRRLHEDYAAVGVLEELGATYAMFAARFPAFFGPPFDYRPFVELRVNQQNSVGNDRSRDDEAEAALHESPDFLAELRLYQAAVAKLRAFQT